MKEACDLLEEFVAERLDGRLPDEQIVFALLFLAGHIGVQAHLTAASWRSVCELSWRTAWDGKEEGKP